MHGGTRWDGKAVDARHLDERGGRSILDVFDPRNETLCQARVALTAILSEPISESAAKAAVAVSRAVQGSDDTIVEHPPWPRCAPERRLQRWQFTDEYLSIFEEGRREDIVPCDRPLSYDDVKQLSWWRNHSQTMAKASNKRGRSPGFASAHYVDSVEGLDD